MRAASVPVMVSLAAASALWVGACAESSAIAPGAPSTVQSLSDDDDLWAMIPAEADLVLFADLAKLRESPWTRESFEKASPGASAVSDVAIGQIRTMDRLIFAKLPSLGEGASVLVAQGRVDRQSVAQGFLATGGRVERSTYRRAELLIRGDEALAFLGKRTALSGFTIAVRAALDCYAGVARAIASESWLTPLRREVDRGQAPKTLVASLYVHLQPATRAALVEEMGEGGDLEDLGARIDLDADLDGAAIGMVRSEAQARDLAARLGERIREVHTRPIVAAFGLGSVLDSLRFEARGNRVRASVHMSHKDRNEISQRMSIVMETLARMRTEKPGKPVEESGQP
jgi:hypothetical protein